ncbi:MAG: shikimate dehydrogenase [Eubacteriales bacterium]
MITSISGKTKVVGIFGCPVEHSFSPAMHNNAFNHLGLDYVYVPFLVKPENLAAAVAGIRAQNLAGVNVTIPHKGAVIDFLDELAPEAKLIGAVNTIVNREGVLKGYNTDAPGFIKSLEHGTGLSPRGKKILLVGAGGAARAISIQLALAGASEIIFATPIPQEVESLRPAITGSTNTTVGEIPWNENDISGALGGTDILINATPLGMYPNIADMPPVRLAALRKDALVCDLIYNPAETILLRKARECGLATLNGMGMLLYQGAIAFELWTGVKPPLSVMKNALHSALNIPK